MQKRAVRLSLLALLVITGIAAAALVWESERRIIALDERHASVEAVVEQISPSIADITIAQQAFIDYGLQDDALLRRVSSRVGGIATNAAALRPTESGEAAMHLEEFWAALSAVATAEAEARDRLTNGETAAAADRLLGAARDDVTRLASKLQNYRAAEQAAADDAKAEWRTRRWAALGGTALLWILVVVALVPVPTRAGPAVAARTPEVGNAEAAARVAPVEPAPQPQVPAVVPAATDVAALAQLCASISRLTDAAVLPDLLARAAALIDARGLIVWMGAGDELLAAAAVGYDQAVVKRLPAISRRADNATAAAWRDRELRTVRGDGKALGAIVAPMVGVQGNIGVLAAEVKDGRERDTNAQAIAAIIASQLASVLAAWPAASSAAPATVHPLPARGDGGSDREAAAS